MSDGHGSGTILAMDAATPVGSVALLADDRVLMSRYFDLGLTHSQRLGDEVQQVLSGVDMAADQLDAVAVTSGPGSFTGLRIGLSTAKGLCFASGASLVMVPTLEALAAGLPFCRYPICPMLDARRGEVYTALYETTGGHRPVEIEASRAAPVTEVLAALGQSETVFVGDGADAHRDLLSQHPWARLAPAHCSRPHAATVARLAQDMLASGQTADLATAEPEYVRHPQYRKLTEEPLPT